MKIAVTSSYTRSRHAIGLITLLHRAGHRVGLCLNVRALNPRRIRMYFRQYGIDLFAMVRRRMLSSGTGSQLDPEVRYIHEHLLANDVQHATVAQACAEASAKLMHVSDLNHTRALSELDKFAPELIVYAGGGILRKPFLNSATLGVLNAHGGPLPEVRGMNASEWALFLGMQPGVTVHWIDAGVDTGPILFFRPQSITRTDTMPDIRGKGVVLSVESLLTAVEQVAAQQVITTEQKKEEGRQYFRMHPLILEIVQDRIRRGVTPSSSGA